MWQWLRHGVALDGGSVLTSQRFAQILDEEMTKLRAKLGAQRFDGGHFAQASSTVWDALWCRFCAGILGRQEEEACHMLVHQDDN